MRFQNLKWVVGVVSCLIFSTILHGQNSPQYSNFMFNRSVINPAAIGSENVLDATLLYRNQWVGIKGNPTHQTISVHSPLNFFNSSAGIQVVNEMQGAERATHILLAYAYKVPFKFGGLSFGISGGIIQKALDGTQLRAPQGIFTDQAYEGHNDPFIPEKLTSDITPEINLGVYFNNRKMFAGIAVNNVVESNAILQTASFETQIEFSRYYSLIGGYILKVNEKLNLLPNVLIKTDFIQYQTDFNLLVQYNDNIYGGLSFRGVSKSTNDAVIAMLGFRIFKQLRIGYSYDFSVSSLNNANSGSHEIFLGYKLNLRDLASPGKIIYNPRFL